MWIKAAFKSSTRQKVCSAVPLRCALRSERVCAENRLEAGRMHLHAVLCSADRVAGVQRVKSCTYRSGGDVPSGTFERGMFRRLLGARRADSRISCSGCPRIFSHGTAFEKRTVPDVLERPGGERGPIQERQSNSNDRLKRTTVLSREALYVES